MEFLDFAAFCGRKESNDLFNYAFITVWIRSNFWKPGLILDDDFSMYMMGGEL